MYNAPRNNYVNNKVKNHIDNRSMNSFSPLFKYNIECYKSHNFGQKYHNYKRWIQTTIDKQIVVNDTIKVWRKKQEKCSTKELYLTMHAQNKEIYW